MASDAELPSGQFSFARRDDGTVIISYGAAPVTALRGRAADRFIERIGAEDGDGAQRVMERAARPPARRRPR